MRDPWISGRFVCAASRGAAILSLGAKVMTCGVCGSEMKNRACSTCVRWFGTSSKVTVCKVCHQDYGSFRLVERQVALGLGGGYFARVHWSPWQRCPSCRIKSHQESESYRASYPHLTQCGTLLDYAGTYLRGGTVTKPMLLNAQLGEPFVEAAERQQPCQGAADGPISD